MLYLIDLGGGDSEFISADNFHELFEEMEKSCHWVPPYEYPIYEVKKLGVLSFKTVNVLNLV